MITANPSFDRKRTLAHALMQRGLNSGHTGPGNAHWTNGLAQAIAGFTGARMNRNINREEDQYNKDAQSTLANALNPNSVDGIEGPVRPQDLTSAQRYEHMVKTLSGHEGTAPLAMKLKLGAIESPRKTNEQLNYEYRESLPPEDQVSWDNSRMANQWRDVGDKLINIITGEERKKGFTPGSSPEDKADAAAAVVEATNDAESNIETEKNEQWVTVADAAYKDLAGANLDLIYGRGESLIPDFVRSQEGQDMMANRDQIVGILQLAAVGALKGQGPITEGERAVLKDAVAVLSNPNISPTLARQKLNESMQIIYGKAGMEFTPIDYTEPPPNNPNPNGGGDGSQGFSIRKLP